MNVFNAQKPGLVFVAGGTGQMGVLTVSGGLTGNGAVIITRTSAEQRVNNQYQPALDNSTYIYCFGDAIGSFTISGVTFSRMCNGGSMGIGQVLSYYAENRAIRDTTITLTLGGNAFTGYLHHVVAGLDNPDLQMGFYTLTAATLPEMFR